MRSLSAPRAASSAETTGSGSGWLVRTREGEGLPWSNEDSSSVSRGEVGSAQWGILQNTRDSGGAWRQNKGQR